MKKKKLKEAELRVVKFELSDVIVASGNYVSGYCQVVTGYNGKCVGNGYTGLFDDCNSFSTTNPDPGCVED